MSDQEKEVVTLEPTDPSFRFGPALQRMQKNLEQHRQGMTRSDMKELEIKKPMFLRFWNKVIRNQYYEHTNLLLKGKVVWAATAAVNEDLFTAGKYEAGAALVYGNDPALDENPYTLLHAATEIFNIKGTVTQSDMQKIADIMVNDKAFESKLPIPTRLTEDIQCYFTTRMIFRECLPDGIMMEQLLPIVIAPDITETITFLPKQYWDLEFISNVW